MFFKKLKKDRGDSTLVSTIIVIPLILAVLITIVDTSLFFNNRSYVVNATRDAARTVAIFGGDGNASQATPLEKAYGGSKTTACAGLQENKAILPGAYSGTTTSAIECQLMKNLATTPGLVNMKIVEATCGPEKSGFIGQQGFCEVKWRYDGLPASGLTFLRAANNEHLDPVQGQNDAAKSLDGVHTTRVTSAMEVNMNGIPLQAR